MLKNLLNEDKTIVVFKDGVSGIYVEDSQWGKLFSRKDTDAYLSEYNDNLRHEFDSNLDIIKIYQLEDYANLKLIWERL